MKIMTFNMRVATHGDGMNSFWERKPRILDMLRREDADIIGVQEATDEMRAWLRDSLIGYTVIGCGREGNYRGESVAVAIKNSAFEIISLEHFWLSPTPNVPGSRYTEDQSMCPRLTLCLRLSEHESGKCFWVYNSHLDHVGAIARKKGNLQNVERILATYEKFIFMGDLNAEPGAPEIAVICERLGFRGCRDVTAECGGTFHGYGQVDPKKIDYIFTDAECVAMHRVEDSGKDGLYYSDHNAVIAEVIL